MKSIMYHYIREFDPNFPNFIFLNQKHFDRQITYFKAEYEFFDCNDLSFFQSDANVENKIFLTFDDGLSCHYDYAFKLLKQHYINGIFYIPTKPYIENKILNVHKIHLILGKIPADEACAILEKNLRTEMLSKKADEACDGVTYQNQKNTEFITRFKRTLNYYLKPEYKDQLIDLIFTSVFGDVEHELVKDFYLSLDQIQEMKNAGMVIGSHGHSHALLAQVDFEDAIKDIDRSFEFLEPYMGYKTFCYPYGGFHSFTDDIENYLMQAGVKFSMNVEYRDITDQDLQKRPQALPRFDCNQFPHGQIDRTRDAIK